MSEQSEAEKFTIEAGADERAHAALDTWLDDCLREASVTFDSGRSGYIGSIKLCAFVSDDGIALSVERSFEESL